MQRLLFNFPAIEHAHINTVSFQKLIYNRKTEDYRKAIEIAKMIILNYSPDITAGKHNVFAIMFDMNSLWEEYIYRKLLEVKSEEISIDFQASDEFWGSRKMKPDLIIEDRGNKYVVDTKWKVINNAEPSDEDLRQIFAYNQYWDTEKGFLLYPKTNESPSTKPKEYHKGLTSNNIKMTCQVLYLNVISESVLNEDIGIELIDLLRDNKLNSDNKN
ncbi:MAG: 5-methylcytosine-specific restriction enzyme subunit McrC [Cyclobacteriaceae bacterium]